MDLLRAYNKESRQQEKSRQHVVDNKESRQYVVDSIQGGESSSLPTVYCLQSTKKSFLSTVYRLLSAVYRPLSTDKGIALVMVIVLSAISLALMAALIYMITSETQISGVQKRYKTAREAGIGGSEVAYQLVALRGQTADQNAFIGSLNALVPNPNAAVTTPGGCIRSAACTTYAAYTGLAAKLNLPTSCWSTECDKSLTITAGTTSSYDMQFDLGTTTTYRVYAKIVDTVEGNSGGGDEGLGLFKGGVVSANSGEVQVQSKPYLYTIEVLTENPTNPEERAKLSILYQY